MGKQTLPVAVVSQGRGTRWRSPLLPLASYEPCSAAIILAFAEVKGSSFVTPHFEIRSEDDSYRERNELLTGGALPEQVVIV